MDYTNKLNLPQYIVDWLEKDNYDHDHDPYTVSATTLMKPTRATLLTIRYADRLQQDVSDLIASRVGNAIHDSIERIETDGVQKEVRVMATMDIGPVTYKVTGKFDVLTQEENGTFTLRDIKTTSVWSYILGGKDEDYERQLSIYRYLLTAEGYDVNDVGYIDFFFTDWQGIKARNDKDYPQHRIHAGYRIQLMTMEDTETYIREQLEAIERDRNKADDNLTPCTRQELWAENEKYAVYKNGAKRASRVLDSREEAEEYKAQKRISGFIQKRDPKVRRCNYCSAFPFCNQGQSYANQGLLA